MKLQKIFTLIFILIANFVFSQQVDEYVPKKPTPSKQNRKNVYNAIKKLRDGGAVIYIVKDRKVKSDALKDKGLEAKARELEIERMKKQKIIVKGLAENFRFCPIYFIYQSDLEKVQNGVINGNLLDTTLSKNAFISFNHSYFMFLDYGDVYDEQGKVYCDTCKSDISGKTALKNDSFIFKNKYMSQLSKPFPYYITCHYPAKHIVAQLKKMNAKLFSFYGKANE